MYKKCIKIFLFLAIALSFVKAGAQNGEGLIETSTKEGIKASQSIPVDSTLHKAIAEDSVIVDEMAMEIAGLIIDQTRSKAGHDFYDRLYTEWEVPPGVGNYLIKIEEKPYRVNITMLEVWVNDEMIGSAVLQPRQDLIEELVVNVNEALKQYLLNYKEMTKQLESEDVSGTGIY